MISSFEGSHRLLLFILLAFKALTIKAQTSEEDAMRVIPPSPNASAFSKYGNIPVSTYNGVPNISIPLYEIKIKDIKVPISITYHASGIKVSDEASRIGLGWVLNCGGVITRSIMNRDDFIDAPEAFLNSLNESPAIPQGPGSVPVGMTQGGTVYHSTSGSLDLTNYLLTGSGEIDPFFKSHDFEPDQFTYNFLGYSGKFVLNKNREVILEKHEKIRIRPLTSDGSSWEITTPDGFVYKFADYEYFVDYNSTAGYPQKSAWYLTEIISPQNEHVTFHYTTEAEQYINPVGSFYERWAPVVLSSLCGGYSCRPQNHYFHPVIGKNYSNICIDYIEWGHGKLKFNVADDREDIDGDKRITSIQIFGKDATEPHEQITFLQDYFVSVSSPNSQTEFSTNHPDKALKRLKLTGLIRQSLLPGSNLQPQEYSFTYYETGLDQLPPKNSFARDHWGYANGKSSNTSLIPSYSYVLAGGTDFKDMIGVMGNERDPSESHMRGFSLKTITYPTQGSTTFYYSANTFDSDGGGSGGTVEPESYPETTTLTYDASNKGEVQTRLLDLTDEYANNQGDVVPVSLNAAFRTNGISCDNVVGSPNVYFELYTEANQLLSRVTPNLTRCSQPEENACISCLSGSQVFTFKNTYVLPPGKYYWKAFMESNESQIVDIVANYTWYVDATKRPQSGTEPDGSIKKYRIAGGLRVSKIEDFDPETGQVNVRRYEYHYKTDVDQDGIMEVHSYGKRMAKPAYSYFDVAWEQDPAWGIKCFECLTLLRDSGHPLANLDGYSVGYDKVIEYFGLNGENGYTEYEYENYENEVNSYIYPYNGYDIPIRPPLIASVQNFKNGFLKSQTHFKSDGTRVMRTENDYVWAHRNIMYGLSSSEIRADDGLDNSYSGAPGPPVILMAYRTIDSTFPYTSETRTISYWPNGDEAANVRTQFFYDNPIHLQLTKKIQHESNLHKTITTYTYPADYSDTQATIAVAEMKGDKFMHGLPIETTVIDESASGSGIKLREFTVYDKFDQLVLPKEKVRLMNNTLLAPSNVPSYIPANTYDEQLYRKVYSLDYDEIGNLKNLQKTSDIPIGYLWGYGETLPIAEIKNGSVESSFHTSFEEDGITNPDARTGSKVWQSTYQLNLPAQDGQYRLSYWQKTGSNPWALIEQPVVVTSGTPQSMTIGTTGSYIDEVRLFPSTALITTYTYNPLYGITSITDANNLTTYYEYDGLGRLQVVRDHEGKILKTYAYRYKR